MPPRRATPSPANLGHSYRLGRGVAVDHAQALAWYRKSAEGGEADGQYWLGRYVSGFGGVARPDPPETVRWFRRAADDGMRKRASTSARSTSADLAR